MTERPLKLTIEYIDTILLINEIRGYELLPFYYQIIKVLFSDRIPLLIVCFSF